MSGYTYSFLDVLAALNGPGAIFSIGSGAGVSEEGISFEPSEELDKMDIGSDGFGMHSLIANKSGKLKVSLLKTSPTNQLLQQALNFQRLSGSNHGQNTITVMNKVSGDVITAQQAAFSKQPIVKYSKAGDMLEWEFNAILVDVGLGAGQLL